MGANGNRHDFERRLNDEIGCADGCSCLTPAIHLAEEMSGRIAELEAEVQATYQKGWDDALRTVGKLPPLSDETICDGAR